MRITKRLVILMIVLLGLLWAIPSQATESYSIEDDPYAYYQDLFMRLQSDGSIFEREYVEAKQEALEILGTLDDALMEDYEYFRMGDDSFPDFFIFNPFFIAYIFSQQYSDDPRYDLDFLIKKGDERIAEPQFLTIMEDHQTEIEIPIPDPSETYMFDCIFSFPHLVLGYRGGDAVPYLMQEWLDRSAVEDESYHYFEYALRASGVEALPYIKQTLEDEELNKKQGFTLVNLLNDMVGQEIYRNTPGTPYVLDQEERGEVWQFMFDHFFEHPYELSGWGAISFLSTTEFEPDTDRLIEFLKVETNRSAVSRATHMLQKHITKDDERLLDLIPTITELLSKKETLETGILFFGMFTESLTLQFEEPYASAFYPPLYSTFLTTDNEEFLWELFCSFSLFQDKILSEWGAVEINMLLNLISEFGNSPYYFYLLNELSQRNKFDLSPYVSDIAGFIPQPAEYEDRDDADESVNYYLDILIYISTENPEIINDNLEAIHDRLIPWVGVVNLDSYASIITNLEEAGITIKPDVRELD